MHTLIYMAGRARGGTVSERRPKFPWRKVSTAPVKGEVYRVYEVGSSSIHDSILIAKPTLIKPWRCRCRKHLHKRVSLWRAVAFGSTLQTTRDASFGFPFRRRPTFTSISLSREHFHWLWGQFVSCIRSYMGGVSENDTIVWRIREFRNF